MTHSHHNLLGEPPATLLPADEAADAALDVGCAAATSAGSVPAISAASGASSAGSRVAGGSPSRFV
ncbi:MAG: hypothetical protein JWR70_635, partial [Modestobacter sp.]|nr:hypothetical protein [Modestobacter sp.]